MHKVKTQREAKREIATRAKRSANGSSQTVTNYNVTLVPRDRLRLIASVSDTSVVEAPCYNAERDEPAFQNAWQQVGEMTAKGKVAPIPPTPGGIRLRGSRAKSDT